MKLSASHYLDRIGRATVEDAMEWAASCERYVWVVEYLGTDRQELVDIAEDHFMDLLKEAVA